MRYLKLAGSHRLAAILLGATGLAAVLGGTLPQSARLSPQERQGWETEWSAASSWLDSLRLSDIFGSMWFTALMALLFANLAIGTGLCLHSRWSISRNAAARRPATLLVRLSGLPLLHFGLLVVIAGGWWSATEGFGAHLELTREEVYAGDPDKLVIARGNLGSFPARVRLDDTDIAVDEEGRIREMKAAFTYEIGAHSPRRAEVRANQPLELDGYRLFPNNSFGYTAILDRLLPDSGHRLMLVNFKAGRSDWGKSWEFARQKRLELSDSPPKFLRMTLSGPEQPRFSLQGREGLDEQLRPGEEVDLGPYRLRFRGIAPWMGFYLARDSGQGVVFVGILLTLAGFLLHLTLPYRCTASESGRRLPVAARPSIGAAHTGKPGSGEVIRC
ncbi:cytochrome c biogenesis protein ResB [Thiohalomonas denitrificans]|uniref:cytochrome c biogenesis protein ResB n=1 Tax=Thiohalomonas denitrificans TaxID=415747 RepID=UPI0026EA0D00|nr:cytochrome c biogenesis protein ResB [Thiohalomonas denitrificans]